MSRAASNEVVLPQVTVATNPKADATADPSTITFAKIEYSVRELEVQ